MLVLFCHTFSFRYFRPCSLTNTEHNTEEIDILDSMTLRQLQNMREYVDDLATVSMYRGCLRFYKIV